MRKKILIINSDSPKNKGDQAILLGNIKLIRSLWKDSDITAISDRPCRDQAWFGINFINQKVYTINPLSLLKLAIAARKFDYVFWGGGELLKDYTNKIAPIYWFTRILLLNIFGVKVFGLFQGIGPSESRISKLLIAKSVNMTNTFFVRDNESRLKLLDYGANPDIVVPGYDPAILNAPSSNMGKLLGELGLERDFIEKSIIISPRKWFHYKKSTWIPASIQRNVGYNENNEKFIKYRENLVRILVKLIDTQGVNLIFFPMFTSTSEGDAEFCHEICKMIDRDEAIVVDSETTSPESMLNLFSSVRASIGSRLHSSIVSISAGTPSVCLYYVDKGRIFFEQIDAQDQSFPIESILEEEGVMKIQDAILRTVGGEKTASAHTREVNKIREELLTIFNSYFEHEKH